MKLRLRNLGAITSFCLSTCRLAGADASTGTNFYTSQNHLGGLPLFLQYVAMVQQP